MTGVNLVESWIVADSAKDKSYALLGKKYPVGTWMGSMKIDNNEIWMQYVKTGKVHGFSIEAMLGQKLIEQSAVNIPNEGVDLDPEELKLQDLRIILEEYLSTLK